VNQKELEALQSIFGEQMIVLDGSAQGWEKLAKAFEPELQQAESSEAAALTELVAATQEFVRRCEAGQIRSTHSYGRFKAALTMLNAWPEVQVRFTEMEVPSDDKEDK
jgi:hypothetical protein